MDRTATDTIDGFNYQFNKSVLEILKADSNTNIILEGYIEDIDVFTNDGITAIQCKYYDSNEKYYWDSAYCVVSMSCTPVWNEEQHKIVK